MLILALDTTSEHGGVALYRDTECLGSISHTGSANEYAVALFDMVERLREATGHELHAIDLFAAANGPGSFTGIRVGLAAVQGWATAFGRPVRAVSVLEAMVESALPESTLALPVLDARRSEFYVGVFKSTAGTGLFTPQGEGMVLKPAALLRLFRELRQHHGDLSTVTVLVRQTDVAAREVQPEAPEWVRWQTVPGLLLEAIARVALRAARQGRAQKPAELDACYLRRSDAELRWQEP